MENTTITRVKKFRIDSSYTQTEMANILKVAQPTLARLEKRGIRKVDTAKRYAEILKTNPLTLLEI